MEGHRQAKIDTLISYDGAGARSFKWGAQARNHDPLFGIKLKLDPDQELPLFFSLANDLIDPRRVKVSAEQAASDYLGALHKHAESSISERYPKSYLDKCSRKYILTVPAVWSDRAKNATLNAARSAGIRPVHLITEPEAAALYTLHTMRGCDLNVGDAFVVCDAGGGTVDLVSYEVKSLSPRVELLELVASTGEVAGSFVLNKRFESVFMEVVGKETFDRIKKTACWERAVQEFDRRIKVAFMGGSKEEYVIEFLKANLPDDPEYRLEDDCWTVDGIVLRGIFEPVINRIKSLVEDQVRCVRDKRGLTKCANHSEIKVTRLP